MQLTSFFNSSRLILQLIAGAISWKNEGNSSNNTVVATTGVAAADPFKRRHYNEKFDTVEYEDTTEAAFNNRKIKVSQLVPKRRR